MYGWEEDFWIILICLIIVGSVLAQIFKMLRLLGD